MYGCFLVYQFIPREDLVTFVPGFPYVLTIFFSALHSKFYIRYNTEELAPYSVPSGEYIFANASAQGDIGVEYMGFPLKGTYAHLEMYRQKSVSASSDVDPAVPVGTIIIYKCPEKHKLAHDWYAYPGKTIGWRYELLSKFVVKHRH